MLLNFLTALAWIWGGVLAVIAFLAVVVLLAGDKQGHESAAEAAWWCFLRGLPAWAWLIARYWM